MRIALFGNGKSIYVQTWVQSLRETGAEITTLTLHPSAEPDEHEILLRMPLLPARLHYYAVLPQARRWIDRLKPDLVIGHFATGYGSIAALAGFHPSAIIAMGSDILTTYPKPLLRRALRFNLHHVDLIISYGAHMADEMVSHYGVARQKIVVQMGGISLERFSVRAPQPQADDPIRILSTRGLAPLYRIEWLIQAVAVLRDRGVQAELSIAGAGPRRAELEALTAELSVADRVNFLGYVPNTELPAIAAQHNFNIALVLWDGVSASLLEAMASGLFPIMIDNPANAQWIRSGENGLLIQPASPAEVADAIQQAAGDVMLRQRAQAANYTLVTEKGDLQKNMQQLAARFEALIAAHKRR